ncbi:hypothetical protein LOK49_LG01G01091 [Camellia lanceoleosa]|uniref:Uncharacterized protein n=1 Tax=Camellia lanceoleosa TaxID=1840588 RepID=A0ACC0IY95_9ERIC|nr:hypothetical protein LOK49_LG01G01091 [Camellia lanceoleosa]
MTFFCFPLKEWRRETRKLFYSDKKGAEENIWRKTIDFTFEASEKLKPEDCIRVTMQYGGVTNSYRCIILRRYYKMETIKYCNKLNELDLENNN